MGIDGNRNKTIDALRGLAIVLVMIFHTISVNTIRSEETIIYNVIWSLQIPLFILISGYVTKYSTPINNNRKYFNYLAKRSLTYILPWAVWVLIRGIMLSSNGDTSLLSYIKYIVVNMDSGYWFLFSLWTISIIFGTSAFIANKCTIKKHLQIIITVLISIMFSGVILAIGVFVGITILGIKLTLYYLPFFYIGYLYSCIDKEIAKRVWFEVAKQAFILPAIAIYAFIILNNNLYLAADTPTNIIIRMTASLLGCALVIYAFSNTTVHFNDISGINKLLLLAGQYSLELYIVHDILLSIIKTTSKPELLSVDGVVLSLINFTLMILFSIIIIYIISSNKWSRLILFGKK